MKLKELNLKEIKDQQPLFRRVNLLYHEQIPKPLHRLNPRTIKGKAWWDRQRQKAYRKNNYCCHACGEAVRVLDAHEVYDVLLCQGRTVFVEIVALCKDCHNTIHIGFTEKTKGQKEVDRLNTRRGKLFQQYIQGAWKVPWSKWRLVFEGVEYEPKFKSIDEWYEYYEGKEKKE